MPLQNERPLNLRMLIFASLFAALIAVGALIAIPIGPVPIVLANLFVLLAGLLLGTKWSLGCIGVYLLAGLVGLPVFAGGTGGIARFVGPTGGYLVGYLPAVFVIALISEKSASVFSNQAGKRVVFEVIAMLCGSAAIYVCGVPWLKIVTGLTWAKAITVGMLPFLLGDGVKILAAVPIAKALRSVIDPPRLS
ncbi:MAG: biotin transporter BioY [Proteobacteria bacterium]|nr:biotin transporter BioY [Pseudomonadota bacterium]